MDHNKKMSSHLKCTPLLATEIESLLESEDLTEVEKSSIREDFLRNQVQFKTLKLIINNNYIKNNKSYNLANILQGSRLEFQGFSAPPSVFRISLLYSLKYNL